MTILKKFLTFSCPQITPVFIGEPTAILYISLCAHFYILGVYCYVITYTLSLQTYDSNAFPYFAAMNMASMMLSLWGISIFGKTFSRPLHHVVMRGKLLVLQAIIIFTVLPKVIFNLLVSGNIICCSPFFPSELRGEREFIPLVIAGEIIAVSTLITKEKSEQQITITVDDKAPISSF